MGLSGNRALAFDSDPDSPTGGERLLLAAVRSWALARRRGESPEAIVRPALSAASSERVGALFSAWMAAIEERAARPIEIRCLCNPCVSADERRLIVGCGVAAVAVERAQGLLGAMLNETEIPAALARALNGALAAEGWPLPARISTPARSATAQTVH